ncbi:hypothetical protein PPERSA_03709 [Pseudocohnilembus persalinus]|uniref:Uncharacterized protein n=1 Tax=Pseudocohnilembus persalinus TaxID=266149 RepID=A0A0V0QGJ5_PSEPJ|nr:hypothetical protein PPERSA_03709 [Pseudocohnilembus persalinus]|eukprot:KRX01205.1 hypothetical protein PPERSA_03709 [Pseudocohnilembus persalinus]
MQQNFIKFYSKTDLYLKQKVKYDDLKILGEEMQLQYSQKLIKKVTYLAQHLKQNFNINLIINDIDGNIANLMGTVHATPPYNEENLYKYLEILSNEIQIYSSNNYQVFKQDKQRELNNNDIKQNEKIQKTQQFIGNQFMQQTGLHDIIIVNNLNFCGQKRAAIPVFLREGKLILDVKYAQSDKFYCINTFHHEFFHLMDYQMWGKDINNNPDSKWCNLNFEGFQYGQNIEKFMNKKKNFTPGAFMQNSNIAYIQIQGFRNNYSATNSAEDKAEIFALLIVFPEIIGQIFQLENVQTQIKNIELNKNAQDQNIKLEQKQTQHQNQEIYQKANISKSNQKFLLQLDEKIYNLEIYMKINQNDELKLKQINDQKRYYKEYYYIMNQIEVDITLRNKILYMIEIVQKNFGITLDNFWNNLLVKRQKYWVYEV